MTISMSNYFFHWNLRGFVVESADNDVGVNLPGSRVVGDPIF